MLLFMTAWSNKLHAGNFINQSEFAELQTPTIDSLDTVIFDLSQAVYSSNTVFFPVYFASDDLIYALDFALRYVDSRLVYDTITLAPAGSGLLAYSYLNPTDSTVRFTSSQFVALPNRQPIAFVHFELATGTVSLDTSDFFNVRGLLNGDPCTELVIPPGVTGLHEVSDPLALRVYPNPAMDYINVESKQTSELHVLALDGKCVMQPIHLDANVKRKIELPSTLPAGNYILNQIYNGGSSSAILVITR